MDNTPKFFNSLNWRYFAGWWAIFFGFWMLLLHHLGLNWKLCSYDALPFFGFLGLGHLVIKNFYTFYSAGLSKPSIQILGTIVMSLALNSSFQFTQQNWLSEENHYLQFLEETQAFRFFITVLLVYLLTIFSWIQNLLSMASHAETREKQTVSLAKEAELANLRQQLQPHFLFNSLNSIHALIGSEPREAREMILKLSDFLRGTLKKDEGVVVDLQDEIVQLELYLAIEKHRFGQRLQVEIEVSQEAEQLKIPPLLLQPLVENAVKFGLYDTLGETIIQLKAYQDGHYLKIIVSNPFDPETVNPKRGTGFGLQSIQRRLYLIFSRTDLVQISTLGSQFTTVLTIPQTA
jgi:two-component system, LytTR family, sensor kinase